LEKSDKRQRSVLFKVVKVLDSQECSPLLPHLDVIFNGYVDSVPLLDEESFEDL
jgi:hypothetical protein